jgi:uncharacterized OB-fold protein
VPDPDSEPFWAATAHRELTLPHCPDCDRLLYPPPPRCPGCLEPVTQWRRVSGRGALAGWTVVHAALVPGIAVPYVVVEVELAEQPGLLLTSNLVEATPESLRLGADVELVWSDPDDCEAALPRFRPVRSSV